MTGMLHRAVGLAVLAVALAGCETDSGDLRAWMDQSRRTMPAIKETISEPKSFEPFRYQATGETDPFSIAKLKVGAVDSARGGGGIRPDLTRRREPLEAYPLDSLKMVGNLAQRGTTTALLQADSVLFQVRVGNYIGQNFGRVTRVSEEEIAVREIVQDAAGDWIERDTALRLQVQESRK
jgi:type IV pilus assembly protein PilP